MVQSFSLGRLLTTPWTAAHQASLSIDNSQSLLKLLSVNLVMPYNHLFLCCPLLLLPSTFPSIRVFSTESALRIRGGINKNRAKSDIRGQKLGGGGAVGTAQCLVQGAVWLLLRA